MLRRLVCFFICAGMLLGCAAAEQEVVLPGGRYAVDLPDWMEYSDAVDGEAGIEAYVSKDLEMDYFIYSREAAAEQGMTGSLREIAKARKQAGMDAQVRKLNGMEMLVYRMVDEEDETPCIGYLFEDGEWLIEIDFWYATEEAAEQTKEIISSIREVAGD